MGSINEDIVVHAERAPGPGETVLGSALSRGPGGKGANQAVAAARAGAPTRIVAATGDDDAGRRQRAALESAGVATDRMLVSTEPTGTALITVDGDGENCIVVVPGANTALDGAAVVAALTGLQRGDVVLAQGEVAAGALAAASATANAAGATMVVNLAPVIPIDLGTLHIDILIVNEHEAALLDPGHRTLESRSERLAALTGAEVVITRGAAGALLTGAGTTRTLPAYTPARLVDTTGAGDALCGALAAALADRRTVTEATRWGLAAGALAVASPGAQGADTSREAIERVLGRSGTS